MKIFLQAIRDKMSDASASYATATGDKQLDAKQQENLNGLVLAVLDARMAELRSLVRGSVKVSDGEETVAKLARYKDPRAAYAANALKALELLQGADGNSGIRAQLAAGSRSSSHRKANRPEERDSSRGDGHREPGPEELRKDEERSRSGCERERQHPPICDTDR